MIDAWTRRGMLFSSSLPIALGLWAVTLGCNHPTPRSMQQDALKRWTPSQIASPTRTPEGGPVRVVKVLALVDEDYRTQSLGYDAEILRQFAQASRYTLPALGVRFEVLTIEPWSYRAGSRSLSEVLTALEQAHPGESFDLVVGFVSALPVVEASHDALGVARLLGRHLVIRGIDDGVEFAEFRKEFRAVDAEELDSFHRQRKQHKQTTLLLHEWGHCLGAIHDSEVHGLMHPTYSISETAFSANTLPMIRASLMPAPLPQRARRIREELQLLAPQAIYAKEHARWIEELGELEKGAPAAPAPQLTREEVERFNLAIRLFNGSMFVEAQRQLAPLVARLPANGHVRSMSCQLAIALAPEDPLTARECEAGAKAARRSARPTTFLAKARLSAKNPVGAAEALVAAAGLAPGADDEADAWPLIASVARQAGCVTLAEQAAARAPTSAEVDEVRRWTARTRRWMGLPAPSAQCEHEHVDRFRETQRLLDQNQLGVAGTRISRFPAGPARDSLSCELALRRGALKEANRACERAVSAWPESTLGLYLLGVIAELERRPEKVEQHLAQVVALDPGVDDAWLRLGAALRSQKKTAELEQLKERFQLQFNKPLR